MKVFFIFMREILPILIVLILKIFRRFMISDNDFFFLSKISSLDMKMILFSDIKKINF